MTYSNASSILAIVVGVDSATNKVRIRIPSFHGPVQKPSDPTINWVPTENLPLASVIYPVGVNKGSVTFKKGRAVYVTFENNDLDYPVIVGWTGIDSQITGDVASYYLGEGDNLTVMRGTSVVAVPRDYTRKDIGDNYNPVDDSANAIKPSTMAEYRDEYVFPFTGNFYTSARFGLAVNPNTYYGKTPHTGIDYVAGTNWQNKEPGSPVRAIHNGTIDTRPSATKRLDQTSGNRVVVGYYGQFLEESHYFQVYYCHLDSFNPEFIKVNADGSLTFVETHVTKGDILGYEGNTGNSEGPHLHLQINVSRVGGHIVHVDPWYFLGKGDGKSLQGSCCYFYSDASGNHYTYYE